MTWSIQTWTRVAISCVPAMVSQVSVLFVEIYIFGFAVSCGWWIGSAPAKVAEHLLTKFHKPEPSISCDKCNRLFRTKDRLKEHTRVVHSGVVYACQVDDCPQKGKAYRSKNGYVHHMKSKHSGTTYHCDECNKTYGNQGALRVHFRVKHNGRKYKCPECDAPYTKKVTCDSHALRRHTIYEDDGNFKILT
jgi:DNA-directed RNA polymerase subunit RPC12/RpoP